MEKNIMKMDKEGFENYQKQIEKLEQSLAEVRKYKGETAIFQGDTWHDNPELYQIEAKERSLMVEISKMKNNLNNIEIINKKSSNSRVNIGDKLKIEIVNDGETEEIIILLVGGIVNLMADTEEVSINSPLGSAIYDKKVSDKVEYLVNGKKFYAIIKEKLN